MFHEKLSAVIREFEAAYGGPVTDTLTTFDENGRAVAQTESVLPTHVILKNEDTLLAVRLTSFARPTKLILYGADVYKPMS